MPSLGLNMNSVTPMTSNPVSGIQSRANASYGKKIGFQDDFDDDWDETDRKGDDEEDGDDWDDGDYGL